MARIATPIDRAPFGRSVRCTLGWKDIRSMGTAAKRDFACVARDGRPSFEETYALYFPKIYNFVYYRLLHKETTEDLVSKIFLKVAENFDRYDPSKAKIGTWIYRIAQNVLIDYYRTRKTNVPLHDNPSVENRFSVDFEEEYERIFEPRRKALFAVLAEMDERDRSLIYCAYFLEMRHKEIAERFQMNPSTVSSALMRARQKLRAKIEQSDLEDMLR